MKVGFIGTGHMGNPMARNLIAAGQELVVHDAFPQACENLIELGATWADSPKAVAEQCEVVFTSLPGPKQIDEVVAGRPRHRWPAPCPATSSSTSRATRSAP